MGVLRLDATTNSGFVGRDLVTPVSEVWVSVDVAFDSTYLTNLFAQSFAASILQGQASTLGSDEQTINISPPSTGKWTWDYGTPTSYTQPGGLTGLQFYTVEMHLAAGSPMVAGFWVNGASVGTLTISANLTDIQYLALYGQGGFAGYVYYDNFKAGTTRGASDLYADDFEGDLSGWNNGTPTDAAIVSDPGIAPPSTPALAGVVLAIDNGPLDDPVTWTRIDDIPGVEVESISIKRGRPTERDKTMPGTATLNGVDTRGVLDPTNTGSPLNGGLVPTRQAAVTLYNPSTGKWNYLFRGHTSSLEHTMDPSEKWTEFDLELVDMLDILNDAEIVPDEAGNTVPSESEGDCFYTGQHVDDRLLAVLADAGSAFMGKIWPVSLLQIASGNVNVQGRVYSRGTSLLQVIDEACDSEFPGATNRFVTVDGAFAFRGRYYRFVPSAYIPADNTTRTSGTRMLHWHVGDIAAYKADNTLVVPQGMKFKTDKTDLINTALVSPIGITNAQLASGSQFASNSTSIDDYGPRTSGMSLENLGTDTADDGNTALQETASFASATVHNYKDPVVNVSELVFRNPVKGDGDYAARWKLLTGIELSDLVTVTTTHPGGGGFTAEDHYVEQITYDLKPLQGDEWDVTLTLGLSSKKHFSYIPASWNPPSGGGGSTLAARFSFVTNGLSVQFYDESTPGPSGPITAWDWNFGDSTTHGTTANPSHTYASAGTYTVTLTVTGTSPDGTANKSKSVTVS